METTFISTRKKSGRTFSTQWRVRTEDSELTEAHKAAAWFTAIGSYVTKVEKVTIQSDILLSGCEPKTAAQWDEHAKVIWPDVFTVIHTEHGSACIVEYRLGGQVAGVIANGKSFTLGTWRKYGIKRGHGMSWLRSEHAQKRCTSPERGSDICEFEAWVRLAKGAYNENVSRDFHKELKAA